MDDDDDDDVHDGDVRDDDDDVDDDGGGVCHGLPLKHHHLMMTLMRTIHLLGCSQLPCP